MKMKLIYEKPPRNIVQRNDFQDNLDFFYERYLDYFPKDGVW